MTYPDLLANAERKRDRALRRAENDAGFLRNLAKRPNRSEEERAELRAQANETLAHGRRKALDHFLGSLERIDARRAQARA